MNYKKSISELKNLGWQSTPFQQKEKEYEELPEKLFSTSNEFQNFIQSFSILANQEDTVWFLSIQDYCTKPALDGFAWNEFELQSVDHASDRNEKERITNFWNTHLPIMLSVKNGYAYVALVLTGENKGHVVSGNEPAYEYTIDIADSFSSFFDLYISVLKNERENKQLRMFFC